MENGENIIKFKFDYENQNHKWYDDSCNFLPYILMCINKSKNILKIIKSNFHYPLHFVYDEVL